MADSRSKTLLRVFGKDSPIIAPGEFPALIESRRKTISFLLARLHLRIRQRMAPQPSLHAET